MHTGPGHLGRSFRLLQAPPVRPVQEGEDLRGDDWYVALPCIHERSFSWSFDLGSPHPVQGSLCRVGCRSSANLGVEIKLMRNDVLWYIQILVTIES